MTQKHPPTIVSIFQNDHTSQQFINSKPPTLQILLIQEKIVPQDLNLDPLRFGEQLKQKVCFGRNRIQNQKRFFHFGKTEIRQNTESVSVVYYHFVWLFWKKFSKTLGTECPLFNTKLYYRSQHSNFNLYVMRKKQAAVTGSKYQSSPCNLRDLD